MNTQIKHFVLKLDERASFPPLRPFRLSIPAEVCKAPAPFLLKPNERAASKSEESSSNDSLFKTKIIYRIRPQESPKDLTILESSLAIVDFSKLGSTEIAPPLPSEDEPMLACFMDCLHKAARGIGYLETMARHNGLIEDFLELVSKTEKDVTHFYNAGVLTAGMVSGSLSVIVLAAKLIRIKDKEHQFEIIEDLIEIFSKDLPEETGDIIETLMDFDLVPEISEIVISSEFLGLFGALIATGFKTRKLIQHDVQALWTLEKEIAETKKALKALESSHANECLISMVRTRYDCLKLMGRFHMLMKCSASSLAALTAPLKAAMVILAMTGAGNLLNLKFFGPLYAVLSAPKLSSLLLFNWEVYRGEIQALPTRVQRQWTQVKIRREIKNRRGAPSLNPSDLLKLTRLDKKLQKIREEAQKRHIAWVMGLSGEQLNRFQETIRGMLEEVNLNTGKANHDEFREYFRSIGNESYDRRPVSTVLTHMTALKTLGFISDVCNYPPASLEY